jgi:hypothetical protein
MPPPLYSGHTAANSLQPLKGKVSEVSDSFEADVVASLQCAE